MRLLITLITLTLFSFADEAADIIKRLDNNMRGEDVYMKLSMVVKSSRTKRTIKMENWSKGDKKSFVKITYPPKDRGITFLSLNNQMWQYVPKIERTIKIPPSMMLQGWMGSDITNDDMVKQSSIVDDYTYRIIAKKSNIRTLELIPKPNAPVVWGKIVINIDIRTYTPTKDIFYDEDGKKVREFLYKKVKKFGKYYIPTVWTVKPINKRSNYTQIILEDVQYDTKFSDRYFQKSALKRFSR